MLLKSIELYKVKEFLEHIARTGEAPAAAQRSGAVFTNFPVEDIFQYMRQLHDRHCNTRIGYLEAMRRVRKAPLLGGTWEEPAAFTIEKPPEWYTPWLRGCLRQRARDTIRKSWPNAAQRAALRWARTVEVSKAEAANRQRLDVSAEGRVEDVLSADGGMVGTGEERMLLPPGALLDLELFSTIDFATDRSWTGTRLQNSSYRLRMASTSSCVR